MKIVLPERRGLAEICTASLPMKMMPAGYLYRPAEIFSIEIRKQAVPFQVIRPCSASRGKVLESECSLPSRTSRTFDQSFQKTFECLVQREK